MNDAPRKRGGSKKGRVFQIVKRAADDPLRKRDFRLVDSQYAVLLRLGAGDATKGLRKLIEAAESLGL